jgi:pentatricopeptide repeat protein
MDVDEQLLSYMVRVCAATHDSEKAIRMFNNLQLDGFIEHSKPYNSIIMACASTKRYAHKAIEYWHLLHAKGITPDRHTFTGVLKACAQLGDTQTAYDTLQELKLRGEPVNEHIFNQLIRVYATAVKTPEADF